MKTVLPQNTGPIEYGGVPLAIIVAIGLVIVLCAILWVWDIRQSLRRETARADACEEDKALDRLAERVDRHLTTPPPKRPTGPANRLDRQGIFHR